MLGLGDMVSRWEHALTVPQPPDREHAVVINEMNIRITMDTYERKYEGSIECQDIILNLDLLT